METITGPNQLSQPIYRIGSSPVLDGLTATARLRSDPATAQVPVLALSAAGGPFASDAAKDAGCAFVPKPVMPDELLDHLRAAFATLQQKRKAALE